MSATLHASQNNPMPLMNRRDFISRSAGTLGLSLVSRPTRAAAWRGLRRPELRIERIVVQTAPGRRLTPVAPNANAPYRGYAVKERIVRLQTAHGVEGIGPCSIAPELLRSLLGQDPFQLFDWDGDIVSGPAEAFRETLQALRGVDIALFDLMAHAIRRPVADLLGPRTHPHAVVYDSSLYMEDLLQPAELRDVVYLEGTETVAPVERVARKALWILGRPEGLRILKIKVGRAKWLPSAEAALERDIAVFHSVRRAVGTAVTLLVDGNDGYRSRPLAAAEFALGVRSAGLFAMEEMFPEDQVAMHRDVKRRMRRAGMKTKLAEGEWVLGGMTNALRAERLGPDDGREPLFDIDQADLNRNGYLSLRAIAADCARTGMTIAPHNFASKLGFYAAVHLGLVTPNFEFCEHDDTVIPALIPSGIQIERGNASLTSEAGLGVALNEAQLEKPSVVIAR
jgi:L-alanine-DL-glutamate epimerase-like enolase superfamily enzyme